MYLNLYAQKLRISGMLRSFASKQVEDVAHKMKRRLHLCPNKVVSLFWALLGQEKYKVFFGPRNAFHAFLWILKIRSLEKCSVIPRPLGWGGTPFPNFYD